MPHFKAAYNLARWLTRSSDDAEDIVQESFLRAFTFFDSFQGGDDARAWLLSIVRNTCFTWLRRASNYETIATFDENLHSPPSDPEAAHLRRSKSEAIRRGIEELPPEFREILIMRDIEGLSYREIAGITGLPLGTVMSRLSRARRRLQADLGVPGTQESHIDLQRS